MRLWVYEVFRFLPIHPVSSFFCRHLWAQSNLSSLSRPNPGRNDVPGIFSTFSPYLIISHQSSRVSHAFLMRPSHMPQAVAQSQQRRFTRLYAAGLSIWTLRRRVFTQSQTIQKDLFNRHSHSIPPTFRLSQHARSCSRQHRRPYSPRVDSSARDC
jgi:hypothetical protein